MNDLMSFGIHRLWKDTFVASLAFPAEARILDLASGTGDIARRIITKFCYRRPTLHLVDLSFRMLTENRALCIDAGHALTQLSFTNASGTSLPFADNTFDAITISFGLRNFGNIAEGLREMHRTLKPGGTLNCMEFSQPENATLKKVSALYNQKVMPLMGELVAQNRADYQYLADSIETFPAAPVLKNMCLSAGFSDTSYTYLTGGIVAIHTCVK